MRFGIRADSYQFFLHLLLVFFVGIVVGMERNIISVLAKEEFGIASLFVTLSFIASFGFMKAPLNLIRGRWSEIYGKRKILHISCLVAQPVPS